MSWPSPPERSGRSSAWCARPVYSIERRLTAVHDRLAAVHEGLHSEKRATERPANAGPDLRDMNARLARLEAKGRRVERPVA